MAYAQAEFVHLSEVLDDEVGDGTCISYHVWGEKGGDDADGYYYGVELGTGNMEGLAYACYDEGKLAYLGHGETAVYAVSEIGACE